MNLRTSNTPIADLFSRIKYLENIGLLERLWDIVIQNDYATQNSYCVYYEKYLELEGHRYKVCVYGYHQSLPRTYYTIWRKGFGHLYQGKNRLVPRDNTYNGGYYTGYYMWGYENDWLILIGGQDEEAKNYLEKIYNDL